MGDLAAKESGMERQGAHILLNPCLGRRLRGLTHFLLSGPSGRPGGGWVVVHQGVIVSGTPYAQPEDVIMTASPSQTLNYKIVVIPGTSVTTLSVAHPGLNYRNYSQVASALHIQ